jgi:hypothetical protein
LEIDELIAGNGSPVSLSELLTKILERTRAALATLDDDEAGEKQPHYLRSRREDPPDSANHPRRCGKPGTDIGCSGEVSLERQPGSRANGLDPSPPGCSPLVWFP